MEVGSLSRTAILTAIHRNAHFLVDDPPKILANSFARAFAGVSSDNEFLVAVDSYAYPDFVAHRAGLALRNRYGEDQLVAAVASGTAGACLRQFGYVNAPRIANPARDARLIANALQSLINLRNPGPKPARSEERS